MGKAFPVAFISLFLFSVLVGTQLVNFGKANPYHFRLMEEVTPNAETEPPTISILKPENNTTYASHKILLSLNVNVKYSGNAKALFFWKIYYEADWQSGSTLIYEFIPETGMSTISEFNNTIDLSGIPMGNHTLVVYAIEGGRYEEPESGSAGFTTLYYPFKITGSSSVSFTIDTKPPKVTVLSPEHKVYDAADIPLEFIVDDPASHFSYVLDGQESVVIDGNITLSELSNGEHNVTVYAKDVAGNVGTSDTIKFSVEMPFPTTMVIAPVASVAVVGVGLLMYFRKRNR